MNNSGLITISIFLCFLCKAETEPDTSYAGGSGTSADPYQIATLAQLRLLSETSGDWSKSFILTDDIDASDTKTWNSGAGFSRIGYSTRFSGTFNGNNYTIDILYINNASDQYGMFGIISGAVIKNLGLTNCNITADGNFSGALIGRTMNSSIIEMCYVTGVLKSSRNVFGGISGYLSSSTMRYCYVNADIEGSVNCGGLVGIIDGTSSKIYDCFVTGNVSGKSYYGGIVGQVETSNSVTKCYFSGTITNTTYAIRWIKEGTISNCYFDQTINTGSAANATGLSTSDFSDEANFTSWNFDTIWYIDLLPEIDSVKRPYLRCQRQILKFSTTNSYGTISGGQTHFVPTGNDHQVTAIPNEGCYFIKWQNASGDFVSNENPITFTNINQDSALVAVFDISEHNIKFLADNNGSVTGDTIQTIVYGFNATEITAIPDGGYRFAGWKNSSGTIVSMNNPLTLTYVKCDSALTAIFEIEPDAGYAGGSGTSNDPYQIATLAQFRLLSETSDDWSKSFILTANIDATNTKNWNNCIGFSRIGTEDTTFTGTFDGNNYTIDSLYISNPNEYYGMFGTISGAEIKNLGLVNCNITPGGNYSGALVGIANNYSIIEKCYVTGNVSSKKNVTGGLVGYLISSTMRYCYANITIYGTMNCGGLVGIVSGSSNIYDCFVAGDISGGSYYGGITGQLKSGTITNCYISASIPNTSCVISKENSGSIANCYYDQTINEGSATSATALKSIDFSDEYNFPDWDFDTIWYIDSRSEIDSVTRPYLRWEYPYYTLSFTTANTNGTISGSTTQYLIAGETASEVVAVPDIGYQFVKWQDTSGTLISTDNPLVVTYITNDSVLVAVFEYVPPHNVSFTAGNNGTISGETSQTVEHGANASEVTAVANTGYDFVEWQDGSGNKVSTDNPLTLTDVLSDTSLVAVFEYVPQFNVSFTAGNNGTISGETSQTVEHGANASEVTAVANTGFDFVEWQGGSGNKVSTDNPLTVTNVSSDTSLVAVFEETTSNFNLYTGGEMIISPNPTTGLIDITIEEGTENAKLSVYSISGQQVYNISSFNGGTVDLSDLKQGIYVVEVSSESNTSIARVIKK